MPDLQQIAEHAAGDPIPANCEVIAGVLHFQPLLGRHSAMLAGFRRTTRQTSAALGCSWQDGRNRVLSRRAQADADEAGAQITCLRTRDGRA